ncbi:MAG: ATP-dependent metallopeptidase FtsH/Yme1/Tma family protein [Candidatus Kerfeldbacteria bacterium]|nr:ATP-dependent metallopeptidase FtsH/Yme1/Tma family protein [Candidatus Kerfeldbacteria bacterium]
MRNVLKNFLAFFGVFLLIFFIFSRVSVPLSKPTTVDLGTFVTELKEDKIKAIEVDGGKLTIQLKDGKHQITYKEETQSLSELAANYDVPAEKLTAAAVSVKTSTGAFWVNALFSFLLPFLLISGFLWFIFRQAQGQSNRALSFGQANAREIQPQDKRIRITFADVAGAKEAKEELYEVVEFLKTPLKFISLGARIPKGVLLLGSPGTGKTLLAKAVAGEANVPFFSISGSEFVEMFVGVGASRVRDLFRKAKKGAPAIVFIDEIDAVGRQRGAGLGGSHDEREQTLNQILVEMDGFETDTNVIIIAATNRPDILDPALLRPGRFDRRIVVDVPDINDREAILKVHAKKKPLAPDVSLRRVAERTPGFTGADLANLLNEAAILAARQNKKVVDVKDCFDAIEKVMLGPERKSYVLSEREKKITAYHEAGHALVAHESPGADPVHKVSIISRGRAAGYTLKLPTEDKKLHSKKEFLADLAVMLGGYVVELEVFGDLTTGASNDLQQATKLARQLVTKYGMSDKLGPRTFGEKEELIFLGREIAEQRDYSEKVAQQIDAEVARFLDEAFKTAKSIVGKQRRMLDRIVDELLKKETLEREEFEALFAKTPAKQPQAVPA